MLYFNVLRHTTTEEAMSFIETQLVPMVLGLFLLGFLLHCLLSIVGQKQVMPNLGKRALNGLGHGIAGLLTALGDGVVWFIPWFLGLVRDIIVATARGIYYPWRYGHPAPPLPRRRPAPRRHP